MKKNTGILNTRATLFGFNAIRGFIKKQGVAYSNCQVRLHDRASGILIDKTLTDGAGEYAFKYLNSNPFIVVCVDYSRQFNAVIQDNVVPK